MIVFIVKKIVVGCAQRAPDGYLPYPHKNAGAYLDKEKAKSFCDAENKKQENKDSYNSPYIWFNFEEFEI